MRLSKLHINGFKSFPDRSELGFDTGVTAIVGPNGCGKSNVVDAITWVLGEQSAKSLRGERMEDVLFNGSDARKPTATAEVRLKLADVARVAMAAATGADGQIEPSLDDLPLITRDVEIGRRLYRSGESEYLINGEVCRLRDVHDLLMDSGLGVKAYAVIEQGKIGLILSSRPAERRALIEEAAGVTKYKARRRTAELKLEAAQQNLTRVDDIVFEVEKQRGALKRQAARARRYKRLREELRRWEQVHLARRHDALAREIETAEVRLTDARARETAAAAKVAEWETALEGVRLRLIEAETGATSTREETHAREMEYGRRQQQVQFDRQQIDLLAQQAEGLDVEARDLEARREPARQASESQRHSVVRAREALDAAAARVTQCDAEYTATLSAVHAVEQESDATRAAVLSAVTTLAALSQARDNAAAARDRVAADRERLAIESSELVIEAERAGVSEQQAEASLVTARQDLEQAARARVEAEALLAEYRTSRESVHLALGTRQRELAAVEARLGSLEELEASRATYGDAARLLLAKADSPVRRHGAVADHLTVERSFERAVDALLGDTLQHVVVDRAESVTEALALVAHENAGRCGFLVVDEAASSPVPTTSAAVPAGARALADVVRATGPHAAVIGRLLTGAFVVDTFEEARRLARTAGVPVATRAGEVFRGSGLVTGGSRQDARGILESRAEVAALRESVQAARADVERFAAEEATLDAAIPDADAALAGHVARQHDHEKAIVSLEGDVRRTSDDRVRVGRRLEMVSGDLRRAQDEELAAEQRREESVAAIALHEAQQATAQSMLDGVTSRLQAAREDAEARVRQLSDARMEHAGLTERLSALELEVTRLEEAAADLDTRATQRRQDIERTEVRRAELRQDIQDTERLIDGDVRAIESLREKMRTVDEQVITLRADFGAADTQIRSARHALEGVRSEVMQFEVARAGAASDLSHLSALCVEAVGLPLEQVLDEVARMEEAGELTAPARRLEAVSVPDEDEESEAPEGEAAAEDAPAEAAAMTPEDVITSLKKKIDRLGPVNMMAIEQFDELESRHTFLTTQRKDLLDSIATTGEAIRKIDKTTRERFTEAFHSINTHFETTFTTLFGGGRAGLMLIDQENDPESGIDIIAQPPGKRLQNVQLLSGGEKALTAMALMFAIFKYRPSPFCLLDEIDAPLDDANVGRFVDMLRGMQTHTQFILITHNRKTMEIADRLYGVTMEEPGVSKLISVQLN
ncbi:MAG TPA: chromosome segregation protein SMC [Vicinamibacterales bacterium]|nr:chromosome segregation protein SMC [Vicinamibacterales bacterium]